MRVIITGATGFIGSNVAEILLANGHTVLGVDDLSGSSEDSIVPGMDFEKIDCRSPLDSLFARFRPEAVYHLAAYAAEGLSHHIPVFNYSNNILGTANVLSASYRCGVKHFVFTSSIAAYGHSELGLFFDESTSCNPCDPYGVAKLACEYHIRSFNRYYGGPTFTIFRPHNVFGPRQNISDPYRNVVGIFMRCAMQSVPMPIFGDGTQTRSFSYIDTVANCIASAPFTPAAKNEVFNVGGDESMSVQELADQIAKIMGVATNVNYLPPRQEVMHAHCSHEKVRKVFPEAYSNPICVKEGLEMMAKYVRALPIPSSTPCPSEIEIRHLLPASWTQQS